MKPKKGADVGQFSVARIVESIVIDCYGRKKKGKGALFLQLEVGCGPAARSFDSCERRIRDNPV